jgi:tungstate transport system ATP-binding protein
MYTLREVAAVYGNVTALDVAELSIEHGEVLALVGPSGAGKSTLLRLLAFVEPPARGELLYRGHRCGPDWPDLTARRPVTMVFQPPRLLRRSVRQNVAHGLRLRGLRSVSDRVAAAIEEVGLTPLIDAPATTLSNGEAQRVVLARALVLRPDVLLLDEPTASLDPYNVGLIEDILTRVNRSDGITIVIVTHNIFQARRIADRVALLLNGKVIEVAETTAFLDRPARAETAAFTRGDMTY